MTVVLLVIGLLVGAVLGYLLAHARSASRVAALSTELAAVRESTSRELEAQQRLAAEQLAAARLTEEKLREAFAALSSEALHRNSAAFLERAEQALKQIATAAEGDLAKRQQAIETLLAPLKESLGKVEQQIQQVEKERADAYGALRQQVEAMSQTSELLRAETQHLVQALRSPQTRGAWGEYQLRQVIEFAGMVEHCHFHEQASVRGEEGRLRPDVTVDLPGGKHVIIDAKVPLAGYLDAIAATDPAIRDEQLRRHARHLREHVEQLGSKNYWATLPNTPEFVVLYVPAEAFLSAALDVEPDLIQRALEKNVVIATPTTLILMLLTVAFTWRQEALAANAQKVLELGRELHGRLATMGGHISRLGSQLGSAVESFNKTVASLEGRVLVTARRLAELQVVSEELDPVRQIDVVPRQVQAPELVASASDALVSLADHPDVSTPPTSGGDTAFPELDTASGDP